MNRFTAVWLLLFCTLLFPALSIAGAERADRPEFVVKDTLKGDELPDYYHYRNFFTIAQAVFEDPSPEIRKHFFETQLGLPPEKGVALAIRQAVERGWAVLTSDGEQSRGIEVDEETTSTTFTLARRSLHPDDFPSDEAYMAEVRRREREEARRLGRVLGDLEATLEVAGVSLATFHAHVTGEMAASSSMLSSDELTADHHVWQVEHSFEVGRHAGYRSGKGSE
jgi:hypothetical protein